MDTKIYEQLQGRIHDFGELKIEVFYSLGGYNYFTGNYNPRGVYLLLKPVARGNGMESSVMMGGQRESGFKILLEELKRKSQKKIQEQFAKVQPLSKQIADLYFLDKNMEIAQLVK